MNYIAEIKAFHDLVQAKQLSTGQIALWYALMYMNNKCAWIEWFTVPNITLELNCGLSKSGIHKARNILKQHKVIDFKPNGTKATFYKIFSFTEYGIESGRSSNRDGNRGSGRDGNRDGGRSGVPLNKLNETKLIINSYDGYARAENVSVDNVDNFNLPKFIEKELGQVLNSTCILQIQDWQSSFSDEMIKYAVEKAVLAGVKNYHYVNGIINSWLRNNIKTLDEAKRADEDFAKKKDTYKLKKPLRQAKKDCNSVYDTVRNLNDLVE